MTLAQKIHSLEIEEQRFAIREYSRCVVMARPGSGKTHSLVLKLAYLLGQVVMAPQKIACITYMNDAVSEIIDRLERQGIEEDERLFVGTVHRFCFTAILYPFKDVFLTDLPSPLRIANEEMQQQCWDDAIANTNDDVDIFRVKKLRRAQVLGKQFRATKSELRTLRNYIDMLHERGLIDFDDIANYAYLLVKDHDVVRNYVVSCFPWLVIDEYQDLGEVFNALVQLLIDKTAIKFFIVGDPNQSILGFQGAAPTYLRTLASMPDVNPVELRITRRCLPHIVSIANRLAKSEPIEIAEGSLSVDRDVNHVYCSRGIEEQIEYILTVINREKSSGTPLGQIAILCRETVTINKITSEFLRHDIAYSGSRDQRYDRTPLVRWLEDLAVWTFRGWKLGTPKFEKLYRQYKNYFYENNLPLPLDNELDLQERFFGVLLRSRHETLLVRDWLEYLSTDEGLYLEQLIEGFSKNEVYQASSFYYLEHEVSQNGPLHEMTLSDFALCGRSSDSVFISTLHSSKGLEFDTVIIPELEDGRLPIYLSLQGTEAEVEEQLAEERRLLYVGITRARFNIHLLYSGYYYNRYGRRFQNGPSRFLRELMLI